MAYGFRGFSLNDWSYCFEAGVDVEHHAGQAWWKRALLSVALIKQRVKEWVWDPKIVSKTHPI